MLRTFKNLFEILPHSDRWKFGMLFGLMLIGMVLEVIGIGMVPLFISAISTPDRVFGNSVGGPMLAWLGIETSQDLLVWGGVTLVIVFLMKGVYTVALEYVISKFIFGRFAMIASNLFKVYMFSPYTFHLNRNTAELVRNVTNETHFIAKNVMRPFLDILMQSVIVFGIFGLVLFVEPVITLVALVVLGGAGGVVLKGLKTRLKKHGKTASNERSRIIQGVNEGLGGFKEVSVMNRQHLFIQRFNTYVSNLKAAEIVKDVTSTAIKPVIEFLAVTGIMMIALVMVFQGRSMSAIIPVLTLFGVATIRSMPAITKILVQITTLRYYVYSLDPVHKDLTGYAEWGSLKESYERTNEKLPFSSSIRVECISYRYPNSDHLILRDVSLSIPRGTAVAFVGTSGAGKSTIVDLILGLLDPVSGRVTVDGIDIAKNKRLWQNNVGYIPQFIYLSDDTIRNNIAFGIPEGEISAKKITVAVKASQLEELMVSLDLGLDTIIGERGVRLSGGQRQRIGIARALYDNPEVLIMDEATSALDNATEKEIIKAIESLKGQRTIIMIAHRLTTVMNCDMLFMLKNGELVTAGTYQELLNGNECFKKMATES